MLKNPVDKTLLGEFLKLFGFFAQTNEVGWDAEFLLNDNTDTTFAVSTPATI